VDSLASRYVASFYLKVLHGNLVTLPASERDELSAGMQLVAGDVTLDDAEALWPGGWREGLMASWWAGLWRWPQLIVAVEPLLIPSRSTYEGQGHCFGLSRVASRGSQSVLMRYLDEYLSRRDLYYDQAWAMAALELVCGELGEAVPSEYQVGWSRWSEGKPHDLEAHRSRLLAMHQFADEVAGG
jgi:hypothetical protein